MQLQTVRVSAAVALSVGVAQAYLLAVCWNDINASSRLLPWFLQLGLRGAAWRATVAPIDLLIDVCLSIPAAFLLVRLRPARLSMYLALALIPSLVWLHRDLFGNPYFVQFRGSFTLPGSNNFLVLPLAVWLVHFFVKTSSPDTLSGPMREQRIA